MRFAPVDELGTSFQCAHLLQFIGSSHEERICKHTHIYVIFAFIFISSNASIQIFQSRYNNFFSAILCNDANLTLRRRKKKKKTEKKAGNTYSNNSLILHTKCIYSVLMKSIHNLISNNQHILCISGLTNLKT